MGPKSKSKNKDNDDGFTMVSRRKNRNINKKQGEQNKELTKESGRNGRSIADYIMMAMKLCSLWESGAADTTYFSQLNTGGFEKFLSHVEKTCPKFISKQESFKAQSGMLTYAMISKEYPAYAAMKLVRDVFRHIEIVKDCDDVNIVIQRGNICSIINAKKFYEKFILPAKSGYDELFQSNYWPAKVDYDPSEFVLHYYVCCLHSFKPDLKNRLNRFEKAKTWKQGVEKRLDINYLGLVRLGKYSCEAKTNIAHFIQMISDLLIHPGAVQNILKKDIPIDELISKLDIGTFEDLMREFGCPFDKRFTEVV